MTITAEGFFSHTVEVVDKDTTELIIGALITITHKTESQTHYMLENALTNLLGQVEIAMTPVTEYTVFVTKEPYFSFNKTVDATCDKTNCSACLDIGLKVPLEKPKCPIVDMTIHLKHNYTNEPIKGDKVINTETNEPVTEEPLVTDESGSVKAPIPMDAEYEVVVTHKDFDNQVQLTS